MDRLISLEPSKQVAIQIEPSQKCSGSVTLRNVMYTMPVAFRLQPMNKARYLIRPQSGIIAPLSTTTIEIVYLMSPNAILPDSFPNSDDSFLLHSVVVPGAAIKDPSSWSDNVPNDWFTTRKKQVFIDSAIRILFIGSPVLARLVADGMMDQLREVLEKSNPSTAPADSTDAQGQTLLHIAIAQSRPDLVQLLLEFEPNVEARNRSGRTPLEAAAAAGETLIVELLLAHKATTEPSASSTWGPLHFAASAGHLEVMRLLLLKSADVNAPTSDGRTALHLAVEERHRDCVRLLLVSGAAVDVRTGDGETPLHLATGFGDEQMVRLLLKRGANKDIRSRFGKTAYDIAAECGHFRLFDQLRLGDSLCAAARKGEVRTISRLLENGASVNGRDQHGWTALHRAGFKGWLEAVKTLVERGVDIDARDEDGYTVLHCAAESGQAEVVELLVKKGADVDSRTKKGVTAVQIADSLNYSGIVRILVQGGAIREQPAVAPPIRVAFGGAATKVREMVPAKKKVHKVKAQRSSLDMSLQLLYST